MLPGCVNAVGMLRNTSERCGGLTRRRRPGPEEAQSRGGLQVESRGEGGAECAGSSGGEPSPGELGRPRAMVGRNRLATRAVAAGEPDAPRPRAKMGVCWWSGGWGRPRHPLNLLSGPDRVTAAAAKTDLGGGWVGKNRVQRGMAIRFAPLASTPPPRQPPDPLGDPHRGQRRTTSAGRVRRSSGPTPGSPPPAGTAVP